MVEAQAGSEAALETAIKYTPLPAAALLEDETLLHRFIEDVAQAIHPPETIAARYSLSPQDMVGLIRANVELRRRIQARRAIWQSDDNIEGRIRKYAGTTLIEAMPTAGQVLFDKNSPAGIRLDTLKAFSRMAGVDGLPPGAKDNNAGPSGNQFVINMHFSDGQQPVRLSTTVVDEAAAPDPLPAPSDE